MFDFKLDFGFFLGNSLVNIICQMSFSKKYETDDPEFQRIIESLQMSNEGLGLGQLIAIFPWLRFLPDSQGFKNLKKAVNFLHQYERNAFNEHKETLNGEKIRDIADSLLYYSQSKEQWLDAGFEEVTQEQLEAIISSIFFTGIETILTSLLWLLVQLFHHPEIQTKMYQEIIDKIGKKHQITADDKDSLPYIQAVLNESYRFSSIAPLSLPHKTTVGTSVAGLSIPKGTQVMVNLHSMHHDPTHWNEPEKFKPERWLNADGSLKKEKATHYMPFGAGTRVCVGKRMGEMQIFLIVTKLFSNFEVSLAAGEAMPSLRDGIMGMNYVPQTKFKVHLKQRM